MYAHRFGIRSTSHIHTGIYLHIPLTPHTHTHTPPSLRGDYFLPDPPHYLEDYVWPEYEKQKNKLEKDASVSKYIASYPGSPLQGRSLGTRL